MSEFEKFLHRQDPEFANWLKHEALNEPNFSKLMALAQRFSEDRAEDVMS